LVHGGVGLVEWLGLALRIAGDHHASVLCHFGLLADDARCLFGFGATAAQEVQGLRHGLGPEAAALVAKMSDVWPRNGNKPKSRGSAAWTDREREAVFMLRHRHAVPDQILAQIVGTTRQALDQQIGGATVLKVANPSWPKAWQPSAALLRECCGPSRTLQALQVVATTLEARTASAA